MQKSNGNTTIRAKQDLQFPFRDNSIVLSDAFISKR